MSTPQPQSGLPLARSVKPHTEVVRLSAAYGRTRIAPDNRTLRLSDRIIKRIYTLGDADNRSADNRTTSAAPNLKCRIPKYGKS